ITYQNNASIINFRFGFRWKNEYLWCIIEVKSKNFPRVFKKSIFYMFWSKGPVSDRKVNVVGTLGGQNVKKNPKKVTEKREFLRKISFRPNRFFYIVVNQKLITLKKIKNLQFFTKSVENVNICKDKKYNTNVTITIYPQTILNICYSSKSISRRYLKIVPVIKIGVFVTVDKIFLISSSYIQICRKFVKTMNICKLFYMTHTAPNVQQSGTHLPAFFIALLELHTIFIELRIERRGLSEKLTYVMIYLHCFSKFYECAPQRSISKDILSISRIVNYYFCCGVDVRYIQAISYNRIKMVKPNVTCVCAVGNGYLQSADYWIIYCIIQDVKSRIFLIYHTFNFDISIEYIELNCAFIIALYAFMCVFSYLNDILNYSVRPLIIYNLSVKRKDTA
ncbi:Uncharacterized protein FWK35_00006173, partial [Aphis craccivora]